MPYVVPLLATMLLGKCVVLTTVAGAVPMRLARGMGWRKCVCTHRDGLCAVLSSQTRNLVKYRGRAAVVASCIGTFKTAIDYSTPGDQQFVKRVLCCCCFRSLATNSDLRRGTHHRPVLVRSHAMCQRCNTHRMAGSSCLDGCLGGGARRGSRAASVLPGSATALPSDNSPMLAATARTC